MYVVNALINLINKIEYLNAYEHQSAMIEVTIMAKQFKQAPLPFVGQKRMFLKHFEKVLNENITDDGNGWIIIDVFGGSGLLAHTAKRIKPKAHVIYNDFDNYSERLKHIDDTNRLKKEILNIVDGKVPKKKLINRQLTQNIINTINEFNGYKDLNSIASWLLFSGGQVATFDDLYNKSFYNCIRMINYPVANGYLDDIEIISQSSHSLLPEFQNNKKALLILDPPYLCTKQDSYKMASYFDLVDFLQLIYLTRPPYIFFSSSKSEFIRFIDTMISSKWTNWQSFKNAKRISINACLNYETMYEDNLVYKFDH